MDVSAIAKSGLLGLIIGTVLAVIGSAGTTPLERVVTVLLCGIIGLAIGTATEWLTSLLPTRIARTATYFVISAAIAITISAIVTAALIAISPGVVGYHLWAIPLIVVTIVSIGNLVDYQMYRRTQRRLAAYQAGLDDATADTDR